jgi:protein-tyrosine phosphatase
MNVLFVCTGNICRSPLAEGILREKFKQHKLSGMVDSCGFESFHTGDRPDNRAQTVARKHGIDISTHQSRLFKVADFDLFDRIYVMDSSHYQSVMRIARSESDRKKVDYVMNVQFPGTNMPVRDPWYDNLAAFEQVYDQLDPACEAIAAGVKRGMS